MNRSFIPILGLIILSHQLIGQCRADIGGKVVDDTGSPIGGAQVSLEKMGPGGGFARRFYETDGDGEFMASLELNAEGSYVSGLYWVLAKKEESGYPDNIFAFYEDKEPPQIELDCGSNISDIVVALGPKCAYITHIYAIDGVTGAPIEDARIKFGRLIMLRDHYPETFSISTSSHLPELTSRYRGFPIPSNAEITYQVSAPGYTTSAPMKIQLAPSGTAEITVKLHKSNNP